MVCDKELAFVFPGQGSQKLGMLSGLAKKYSIVQKTFNEASDVLGYNLWQLSQQGSQNELNMTERAQPLLLTASVAIWRIWQQEDGAVPTLMAGHSLGEWSALVCSGVVEFVDAVRLVQLRGKYMQETVPVGVGSMAAIIGLDDQVILDVCKEAEQGEFVSAVNFNSPGQVVIAGHAGAVERAGYLCKEEGAKRVMALAVSAPFHSELLRPAADRLAVDMASVVFSQPDILVVHNVNGKAETNPLMIKQLMIEQIYKPVLWVDCVNELVTQSVSKVVECGSGAVLSGLIRRIDRSISVLTSDTPEKLSMALSERRATEK
ncbi:[acyl-carrier-protein] S-malonyltransferase [Candidatus Endobugula sertula]|uniref:Malonyl CoA-acyl carrier protein transacylase n=1 Tax=Candidatus Endobugula sertula TaxID=62101 RepID=A0A1D2QU50_9GAMM|nr:[acyl-carrier-protein] S-malonyltransferase [Candidatus Endobugula sertula]